MCRHLVYLGPSRTVASVVVDGEHSLHTQSWAPRQMRGGGTVNADGFGACWWPSRAAGGGIGQHRTVAPVWADPALGAAAAGDQAESDHAVAGPAEVGRHAAGSVRGTLELVTSSAVLAAVRSATPGMAMSTQACAPFTDGVWAFSHNGVVRGWPDSVAPLAAELPAASLMTMEAPTDSVFLWQLVRARMAAGRTPDEAVVSVVRDVDELAPESRLNLLMTDGSRVLAIAWRASLWTHDAGESMWVASEPTTRDGWRQVAEGTLVDAKIGAVRTVPIGPAGDAVEEVS